MTPAELQINPLGEGALGLSGELDLSGCEALRTAVEQAREGDGPPLVIDLRKLEFIDSSGLATLVELARQGSAGRGLSVVIAAGSQPARLLELTGLGPLLPTFSSLEEARQAL